MTRTTDRYINLFTDFGFKKIFGEELNKDILMAFLNDLLDGREVITELTYIKNEQLGKHSGERRAIYDLYCTNQFGEKFIVEIQRVKQEFFKDRTLYYSSFAIQEQALKGKDWHYQLKAVYAIAIMDFIFDDTDENTLHHEVMLMDVRKKTVFYEKLTFIYLEIPKFNKNLQELNSNYERWLYAFRNLHRLQEKPVELQKGVFEKLFRQAEIAKMNKTDRDVYEESLKDYRDLKSSMVTYFAEGKQEGLKEGVEIGKEEGLRVGIEKGIEQKEKEVVLESFAEGLSPALIVKITKLTAEKVNVILRQAGLL